MAKTYGHKVFTFNANGKEYTFSAYGTNTRCGFCHHVIDEYGRHTRVSYYNRTWESFTYETTLHKAIEKYPKGEQKELKTACDNYSEEYAKEVTKKFAPLMAMAQIIGSMRKAE